MSLHLVNPDCSAVRLLSYIRFDTLGGVLPSVDGLVGEHNRSGQECGGFSSETQTEIKITKGQP